MGEGRLQEIPTMAPSALMPLAADPFQDWGGSFFRRAKATRSTARSLKNPDVPLGEHWHEELQRKRGVTRLKRSWKRAQAPFQRLRFAEVGAAEATLMAAAGHVSRRTMEHYSHVRKAAKRDALAKLESGLMTLPASQAPEPASKFLN
jgi:hypothetical protein